MSTLATTWVLASLAAGVLGQPLEVHTATRDVRDCAALEHGLSAAATEGGLVLVDAHGRASAPLTALDGLPETRSHVVAAVDGQADQLWVGTEGGLAKVTFDHDPADPDAGPASPRVLAVHRSAPVRAVLELDGRTYVGTWGAGVLELRGDELVPLAGSEPAALAKQPLADRITALAAWDGELVVASAGAGAWISGAELLPGVDGLVWSLAVDHDRLYAGTLAGVLALDRGAEAAITVSNHDARALAMVDGALEISDRGLGLVDLDGHGLAPARQLWGMDGGRCLASAEGLWTRDEGGHDWRPSLDAGLPSGDITDLLRVGDRLYAATFDRGVMVLEQGRWTALPDPEGIVDPQVNALARTPDGALWIATARGLLRTDSRGAVTRWTTKQGLPHDSVLSLATTAAGELIVGTHAGVVLMDEQGDPRPLGRKARRWATWAVAPAKDGGLWLGTTQGLIRWRPDGTWRHLSMLSGHLEDNWVTALAVENEGGVEVVHVGSYAGGVVSLRPSPEQKEEWKVEVLGGGRVNPGGLRVVDGALHAATMKGLLVREGKRWRAAEVGLFEDVTKVLAVDGGLWIASRRGLELRAR
ncbi:hypothetical protein G6O69_08210 [Pseudenhygromyxa sp. WMMC2535]|uniref:ligand-binding sensor domain-containing protein n=1 Tax=Pseudenhygromyxa sp. WMMC2535 TaxID=2712867 RepID=UPI0015535BCF|nr:hypothetical protein [Pseudenhygromyxa sp. WMMC2535]NVB37814.1 hypothetical protein [Pseudenhygromyxa sp. WMMC2535]